MANILIFGFGAVGATYGMILSRAGSTITAVCRSNWAQVSAHGVLIRSKIFGIQTYAPRAVQTISEAANPSDKPYDYIVVASKALPGTAEQIREAVTPGTTAIVLAQNGIGIEEDYARLYPSNPIISGVVYLPVTQVSPGVIEHGPLQRFEIGTYPARSTVSGAQEKVHHLSSLWKAGGADAPVFEDVQTVRWKKLAINAAWNPLAALSLCDDANFLRSSRTAEPLIKTVMAEIGAIATAAGYPNLITEEMIEQDLERPRERLETGGKEPSMLVDVRHGRSMEIEAILGNAVRMAERLDVQVPVLGVVYTLAKARDFALREPEGEWKGIARH